MQKKTYAAPVLTKHGSAVAMTAGRGGRLLELINFRPGPPPRSQALPDAV